MRTLYLFHFIISTRRIPSPIPRLHQFVFFIDFPIPIPRQLENICNRLEFESERETKTKKRKRLRVAVVIRRSGHRQGESYQL